MTTVARRPVLGGEGHDKLYEVTIDSFKDLSSTKDDWNGHRGNQIREFKSLVKKLHDNDIAVIMDVVYNHISQYDHHPLKQLQRKDYFRFDESGEYLSESGCGNDLNTENEYIRSMIVESVLYWMREYHIDGFRFDYVEGIGLDGN